MPWITVWKIHVFAADRLSVYTTSDGGLGQGTSGVSGKSKRGKKNGGRYRVRTCAPTMSRSNRDAQIDIFQILMRTFADRQVRTKTEQSAIYRQVSVKPMNIYA